MKTIKELHSEGKMSTRTYNLVCRNTYYQMSDQTVEDLFKEYGEEKMMGWRNMGQNTMNELKGLL